MTRDSLINVLSVLSNTTLDLGQNQQALQERMELLTLMLGDALRAEVAFPKPLLEWLRNREVKEFESLLLGVTKSIERHILPLEESQIDERVELFIHTLDMAKSVMVGVRRLFEDRVWELNGYEDFDRCTFEAHKAVTKFAESDAGLIERCLADRSYLIDPLSGAL